MASDDLFVNVGKIVKPHGIRGEVSIAPTTDWPEQFQAGQSFRIYKTGSEPKQIVFEKVRNHHPQLIAKLKGVDSRNGAETLRGWYLQVTAQSRPVLPENEFYVSDLIGLRAVTKENVDLGILTDVLQHTGQDLYVISRDGKETLIPAVKEFISEVNLKERVIVINPIEGLIESDEN